MLHEARKTDGRKDHQGEGPKEFREIGLPIREARWARRLTLRGLAERSGLSAGHISRIERNVAEPTLSVLGRLCVALDLMPADLFQRSPEASDPIGSPGKPAQNEHGQGASHQDFRFELLPHNAVSLHPPEGTAAVTLRLENGVAKITSQCTDRTLLAGEGMIIVNNGPIHLENIGKDSLPAGLCVGFFAATRLDIVGGSRRSPREA